MAFTPNKGQIADSDGKLRPDVLYSADSHGGEVYLRKTGISYVFNNMAEVQHRVQQQVEEIVYSTKDISTKNEQELEEKLMAKENIKVHQVNVDFVNANSNPITTNTDPIGGYNNYYYAHCPNGVLYVKQYKKVSFKNIYKGIDIKFDGSITHGLKYDIIVHPHADPKQIQLHWKGAKSMNINNLGNLVITTSVNEFEETLPKVYQNINGKIVDVKCKYKLDMRCEMIDQPNRQAGLSDKSERSKSHISCLESHIYEVSFELGTYNLELPLVIDPWATYYGGNQADYSTGIATDAQGNVMITGHTFGGSFPANNAGGANVSWQGTYKGGRDAFVVKFNSSGSRLWATYYGGNKLDYSYGIATDTQGNVLIVGTTDGGTLPVGNAGVPNITFQGTFGGGWKDAFIVKFNSFGFRLWATFYGGNQDDYGYGIAIDSQDNVLISGYTYGGTFPIGNAGIPNITWQAALGGGWYDAFVVKLNPFGSRLWATYYGGDQTDYSYSVTTDTQDNVLITGGTWGGTFPVSNAGIPNITWQGTFGGLNDAFVVKFTPFGSRLWATYYGGDKFDNSTSIATDTQDNVLITGSTNSGTFPANNAGIPNISWQGTYGGGDDAFVVKFNSFGSRLWGTYYGVNQDEFAAKITTDVNNNIYILMEAEDVDTPTLVDGCSYQPVFNGGSSVNNPGNHTSVEDQMVVKFNQYGKKICSSYIGGTGEDDLDGTGAGGITVRDNSLYVTAYTDGGFPVTSGTAQTTFEGGAWDAYVIQLCLNICESKNLNLDFTADNTTPTTCDNISFTPTFLSCDTTAYKYEWTFTGGSPTTSTAINPTVSFSNVGSYNVKLVVTTPCKKDSITKTNYITTTQCNTCNLVGQFTKGTAACSNCGCKEWVLVNATNGTPPYSYQWPDAYDKRYKNEICPGNYTVKVTDKNGCSVEVSVTTP